MTKSLPPFRRRYWANPDLVGQVAQGLYGVRRIETGLIPLTERPDTGADRVFSLHKSECGVPLARIHLSLGDFCPEVEMCPGFREEKEKDSPEEKETKTDEEETKKNKTSTDKEEDEEPKLCRYCQLPKEFHPLTPSKAQISAEHGPLSVGKTVVVQVPFPYFKPKPSDGNRFVPATIVKRTKSQLDEWTFDVEYHKPIRCTVNGSSGTVARNEDGTCCIMYDINSDEWNLSNAVNPQSWLYTANNKMWNLVTSSDPDTRAYVCGRGARVALMDSHPARCGTVVGFDEAGTYKVRLDNSETIVTAMLQPQTALPEALYQYKAGQKLVVLSPQSSKWEDCVVQAYLGPAHGSRHTVRFSDNGELDVDLNRFNHATAELPVAKFLALRQEYCRNLAVERSKVVDAITGKVLNVAEQTIKIGMANIGASGRKNDESETNRPAKNESHGMVDMSRYFARTSEKSRIEGRFDNHAVLVKAEAGAGKSWGVQQLEHHLASIGHCDDSAQFMESLPLVILGQQLSNLASANPSLKDSPGSELLLAYIKSQFSGDMLAMLMQSLRMQTVVVIFDGVDEVLEIKDRLIDLFADELLAKRFSFVVTTRPVGLDGVMHRFENGLFDIVTLKRLTDQQIQVALNQQLDDDEFFEHLFQFKHLREEQDTLYYEKLAPLATTRDRVERLGDGSTKGDNRFLKEGTCTYCPSMRQRTVDGSRFIAPHTARPFLSKMLNGADAVLTPLFDRLQEIVDDTGIADGENLELAVQKLSPDEFGVGEADNGGSQTTDQKGMHRIAKRLVGYARRQDKEGRAMPVAALWNRIADHTDELLHAAETYQALFEKAIRSSVAKLWDSVKIGIAPLKDPVRAFEKAYDDYSDRFKNVDDVIPLACIIDVLRCSIQVANINDMMSVLDTLRAGVTVYGTEGGKAYVLRLWRVKNKFTLEKLTPSHFRSMLLNVRIECEDDPDRLFVFGEVQIKVAAVMKLLHDYHSHEHYAFFRSLLQGDMVEVDKMLNRLFIFFGTVCPRPILMSLLISVIQPVNAEESQKKNKKTTDGNKLRSMILKVRERKRVSPALFQFALGLNIGNWNDLMRGAKALAQKDKSAHKDNRIPLDQNQLYSMAIRKVLCRWDPRREKIAFEVIKRIAVHNVFGTKMYRLIFDIDTPNDAVEEEPRLNSRVFHSDVVRKILENDEQRKCWDDILATLPEYNVPLIKVTQKSADRCTCQFKHLSFQEVLAAKCLYTKATSKPDSWRWAYAQASLVKSRPLSESLVQSFMESKHLVIDARNLFWSCMRSGVKTTEYIMLQALTVRSEFPMRGKINLDRCYWITDGDLKLWTCLDSHAESLNLSGCVGISDEGFLELLSACRELKELSGVPKHINANALMSIARTCNGLRSLSVPRCDVTDDVLELLGQHLTNLTTINLEDCDKVTDKGLEHLAKGCPGLVDVNLSECDTITHAGIKCLLERCSQLVDINLSGTKILDSSVEGFAPAIGQLKNLVNLNLSKNKIGDTGLGLLAPELEKLKHIKSLNLSQNNIKDKGGVSLVAALKKMQGLNKLDLFKNEITSQEGHIVAAWQEMAQSKDKEMYREAELDCSIKFCGGSQWGSNYGPKRMLQRDEGDYCSKDNRRRFLVVHDLGKPSAITTLEVRKCVASTSDLSTVRVTVVDSLPDWVEKDGYAQETAAGQQISPEEDYTTNPTHPASQLHWSEFKSPKKGEALSVHAALPTTLYGRYALFYCIDGKEGIESNIDIGYMKVHGAPVEDLDKVLFLRM